MVASVLGDGSFALRGDWTGAVLCVAARVRRDEDMRFDSLLSLEHGWVKGFGCKSLIRWRGGRREWAERRCRLESCSELNA